MCAFFQGLWPLLLFTFPWASVAGRHVFEEKNEEEDGWVGQASSAGPAGLAEEATGSIVDPATEGERCCCRQGKCSRRNLERERKQEIVSADGTLHCCKPRNNWGGECDRWKYTYPIEDLVGSATLLGSQHPSKKTYDGQCLLTCEDENACFGNGQAVRRGGHGDGRKSIRLPTYHCECECEAGYDMASFCKDCLPGFRQVHGSCVPACSIGDVDCNGHGSPIGFLGECSCRCDVGYNEATSCKDCSSGFGKVQGPMRARELASKEPDEDGLCVPVCTVDDISCNGNGSPIGFAGECSCECVNGRSSSSNCAECSPGKVLAEDGVCYGLLDLDICLVTINSHDGVDKANANAVTLVERCQTPDVIVFSTQEFTGRFYNNFDEFATSLPGYVETGRCGGKISAGVVTFARTALAGMFQKDSGTSVTRSWKFTGGIHDKLSPCRVEKTAGSDFSFTNTKGTAILEVLMVTGEKLVAASSHSDRGGTYNEGRVAAVKAAARMILEAKGTVVAWAGDFNLRTPLGPTEVEELLAFGTVSLETVELTAQARPPSASSAYRALAARPDILGGNDSLTFAEELASVAGSDLVEIPVRSLCPSYRKRDGNGKSGKGQWFPHFGCQAPGSDVVEYYGSPLDDMKTKWLVTEKSRAPSWTERLIVSNSLASSCGSPDKVLSIDDHDIVFVRCQAPNAITES